MWANKSKNMMEAMDEYIAKTSGIYVPSQPTKNNVLLCNTSIELSKMLDKSLSTADMKGYTLNCGLIDMTQFGRDAINLLKQRPFELLIIDYDLEGSYDCATTIKCIREQNIRVKILVTTNVMCGNLKGLWINGLIDGILLVPYQDAHLYKLIADILHHEVENDFVFVN